MKQQLKVENIKIDNLLMLNRNPQYLKPSVMDGLKRSIKKHGFLSPVLVRPLRDKKFEIISGNHRFLAAKEVGLKIIPCVIKKMTEKQKKILALNLNSIHGDPPIELIAPFLAAITRSFAPGLMDLFAIIPPFTPSLKITVIPISSRNSLYAR